MSTDSGGIGWTERFTVTTRHYYSIVWLQAAELTRLRALPIGSGSRRPDWKDHEEMSALVLSSVVAVWAFLESNVNELYDDARFYLQRFPPKAGAPRGPTGELQERMAAVWPDVKKLPVLGKYAEAIDLAGADPISPGAEPGQSAELLRRLRNHFVHYRPYPIRDGKAEGEDAQLASSMKGKIELPSWDDATEDLLPARILCPDLARWSIQAAVRYADLFSSRTGLLAGYNHVRPAWLASPHRGGCA